MWIDQHKWWCACWWTLLWCLTHIISLGFVILTGGKTWWRHICVFTQFFDRTWEIIVGTSLESLQKIRWVLRYPHPPLWLSLSVAAIWCLCCSGNRDCRGRKRREGDYLSPSPRRRWSSRKPPSFTVRLMRRKHNKHPEVDFLKTWATISHQVWANEVSLRNQNSKNLTWLGSTKFLTKF